MAGEPQRPSDAQGPELVISKTEPLEFVPISNSGKGCISPEQIGDAELVADVPAELPDEQLAQGELQAPLADTFVVLNEIAVGLFFPNSPGIPAHQREQLRAATAKLEAYYAPQIGQQAWLLWVGFVATMTAIYAPKVIEKKRLKQRTKKVEPRTDNSSVRGENGQWQDNTLATAVSDAA